MDETAQQNLGTGGAINSQPVEPGIQSTVQGQSVSQPDATNAVGAELSPNANGESESESAPAADATTNGLGIEHVSEPTESGEPSGSIEGDSAESNSTPTTPTTNVDVNGSTVGQVSEAHNQEPTQPSGNDNTTRESETKVVHKATHVPHQTTAPAGAGRIPFWKRLKPAHYIATGAVVLALAVAAVVTPHKASAPAPASTAPTPTATASASVLPIHCLATRVNQSDPQAFLPDPKCTPGVVNSTVTQANIGNTICVSGFTKTIRPPVSYTNHLKLISMQNYGFTDAVTAHEEDHLISLELGGSPTDPANLWAEPHASPNEKDKVENYLHALVCSNVITLAVAQREISTNWYQVFLSMPH